eukprot:scaffold2755_cov333-Prasinococcus_capsulatus_cf.AAC.7
MDPGRRSPRARRLLLSSPTSPSGMYKSGLPPPPMRPVPPSDRARECTPSPCSAGTRGLACEDLRLPCGGLASSRSRTQPRVHRAPEPSPALPLHTLACALSAPGRGQRPLRSSASSPP